MKKFYVWMIMSLLASVAWGQIKVEFDPATCDVVSTAQAYTLSQDCVQIDVSLGLANGAQFRIYKGQTMKVSTDIGEISAIDFVCTASGDSQYGPGCFVVDTGTYTTSDRDGHWEGTSPEVTFTASTNQVRIIKITVMVQVGDNVFTRPFLSPRGGTFEEKPLSVSMQCHPSQARIFYTIDGTTPDPATATLYTAPLSLTQNTVVKAVAELNGELSKETCEIYEFAVPPEPVQVTNIRMFNNLEDGTPVEFTRGVYVLAQHENRLYIKDATGCAVVYGNTGVHYSNGNRIRPGFKGTKKSFAGEPELTEPYDFPEGTPAGVIDPEEITLDQVNHDMFAHYVIAKNVRVHLDDSSYGGTLTDDVGNEAHFYLSLLDEMPQLLDVPYDVVGVIDSYGTGTTHVYEILPLEFRPTEGGHEEEPLVISPSQVGPETYGRTVTLRQVKWSAYQLEDFDGESCQCRIDFTPYLPAVLCWSYNITGKVEYNQTLGYHVNILGIGLNCGLDDIADIKTLAALERLQEGMLGEYFNLTGRMVKPLTAIYQNGQYLHVQDDSGTFGLVYGELPRTFKNGDQIINAQLRYYSMGNNPIALVVDPASFEYHRHIPAIEPERVTVDQINDRYRHHYLLVEGAHVDLQSNLKTLSDETGQIWINNRYNLSLPEPELLNSPYNHDGEVNIADLNYLIGLILSGKTSTRRSETFDVECFYMPWNGTREVNPVKITGHEPNWDISRMDLNGDGVLNIADINALIKVILTQ